MEQSAEPARELIEDELLLELPFGPSARRIPIHLPSSAGEEKRRRGRESPVCVAQLGKGLRPECCFSRRPEINGFDLLIEIARTKILFAPALLWRCRSRRGPFKGFVSVRQLFGHRRKHLKAGWLSQLPTFDEPGPLFHGCGQNIWVVYLIARGGPWLRCRPTVYREVMAVQQNKKSPSKRWYAPCVPSIWSPARLSRPPRVKCTWCHHISPNGFIVAARS